MVNNDQTYIALREAAKLFYQIIEDLTPISPERVQALINVEQALMWANTALSRYNVPSGVSVRKELFLGYRGGGIPKNGLDWHDFTLNPLAKVKPDDDRRPCNACGTIFIGDECPECGCDQK